MGKNLLLLLIYFVQARFIAINEALLARRVLSRYLYGAYTTHLQRNSANMIRNAFTTTGSVFNTAFMGFVTLATEMCLTFTLMIVLLRAEPLLTMIATGALALGSGLFHIAFKGNFVTWGQREIVANGAILKSLQQGLHSIKEVKILGIEEYILQTFVTPRSDLARIRTYATTLSQAPRLWIESIMLVVVMGAIIAVVLTDGNSAAIMASLTLLAAAAFRVIPSMIRVLSALNGIKNAEEAVNTIYDDIQTFSPQQEVGQTAGEDRKPLSFEREILLNNVTFYYPGTDGAAVKDINLSISKGHSLGLAGPSGAGKTTIVDIILGLLPPQTGQILVDGLDISGQQRQWQKLIGYVPQTIYLTDDTIRRNIAFGIEDDQIDDSRVWSALELAHLGDFVRSSPDGLATYVGDRGLRISGGQRQRIGIARALYHDPEVLILDEATSALDNETESQISEAIETLSGKKTMIIVAHRLSTIRKCDRIIFMNDGGIADSGSYQKLSSDNANFRRLVDLAAP